MTRPREFRTLVRDPLLGKARYWAAKVRFDNRLLAVGMEDGVSLWDLSSGKELASLPGSFASPVFEPGPSGALLINSRDGVYRWPIEPDPERDNGLRLGSPEKLFAARPSHFMAASPDGRVIAVAEYSGATVWRADDPQRLVSLDHHDEVRGVSVSADGKLVATGSFNTPIARVWDAATGKLVKEFKGSGNHLDVRFSPDGKWLLVGGRGYQFYRIEDWEKGATIEIARLQAGFFSPDGKILAIEEGRGSLRLVDPETGRDYACLTNPSSLLKKALLAPPTPELPGKLGG